MMLVESVFDRRYRAISQHVNATLSKLLVKLD